MTIKKSGEQTECSQRLKINRRGFLKSTGVAIAGLGLPLSLSAAEETPVMLDKPVRPLLSVPVGITRKEDAEDAVRTAIELAGGLNEIRVGDRVVIKPNITGPEMRVPARIYTHPEVLRAVIRTVKDRTASSNITVAEASGFRLPSRAWAWEVGILQVCKDEGVTFVGWEREDYRTVFSDHFDYIDFNFRIPASLLDGSFDHFINVPVLKNHEMMPDTNVDYTCCIKNLVGVMHPVDRIFGGEESFREAISKPIRNLGIHKYNLGDMAAELNLSVPHITMNVVDALSIVLTGGPVAREMDKADPGLILASKDRVACDSLALAILKHYAKEQQIDRPYVEKSVWEQAQIIRAQALNLGRGPGRIDIMDADVDNIDDILLQWT